MKNMGTEIVSELGNWISDNQYLVVILVIMVIVSKIAWQNREEIIRYVEGFK